MGSLYYSRSLHTIDSGATWKSLSTPQTYGTPGPMWGSSANVYAVGGWGYILHYN